MEEIKNRYKILYSDEIYNKSICFLYKVFGEKSTEKHKLSLIKKLLDDKLKRMRKEQNIL